MAAVEFGVLVPVFLLLVFGIVDLGHAFYMDQIITTASREGARYGTRYQTSADGRHLPPNALNPSIANWIVTKYASLLPADCNLALTPGGPGYTSGFAGDDITITVTARKNWFVIGRLIPGLESYKNLSATTVMKCE
jgi:Flp pilus assembly protein TadG